LLFDRGFQTKDEDLNNLIVEARDRFLRPGDQQVALEKLWDAFERIKTYFSSDKKSSSKLLITKLGDELDRSYFEEEFRALTDIGNRYRIRHHETGKSAITNPDNMKYLFFRMLSLIDRCLNELRASEES